MDDDVRDGAAEDAREHHTTPRQPWYSNLWASRASGRQSVATVSSYGSSYEDREADCREEDMIMERECGEREEDNSRIHEPLKRHHAMQEQGSKRRRVGEAASMSFFEHVPLLTERQQTLVEYIAPSAFTPLFKFVFGYTPFAVAWVTIMYIGHTMQTMVTTFGPETKSMRFRAWLTPLVHHLLDTYVWNHSMITAMLLYPELFGHMSYWLAVFFTMAQQQLYMVVSLKAHYINNQHLLKQGNCRREIELRFIDTFLLYGLAAFLFTVARLLGHGYESILKLGLVEFNLAPLYLVWAHKQRMDAATIRPKQDDDGGDVKAKGEKSNNKKTALDAKKGQ
jgi:hypothetical protein